MTLSFALLGFAAVALVAALCSAALASLLWVARGLGARLSASARARLLLCAAMLPAIASSAVVIAAIGATTGLFDDHCALGAGGHAHAHLCLSHPPIGLPSVPLLLASAFLAMRLGLAVARLTRDLVLASRLRAYEPVLALSTTTLEPRRRSSRTSVSASPSSRARSSRSVSRSRTGSST